MSKHLNPRTWNEKAKYGFVLFLFTVFILTIDFISNVLRSNVSPDMDWLSWLYYIPTAIGHASLFALIMFLIFYIPFIFIFCSHKIATTIYIFFAILLQIVFMLDGYVFTIYRFHLNGFVLELILGAGREIFVFDFWVYFKFVVQLIFVAVLPFLVAVWLSKRLYIQLKKKKIITISVALLLCIVISHIGHAVASAAGQPSIQKSSTALPFFYPLTAYSLLAKVGIVTGEDVDPMNYNVHSHDIDYPLHPLQVADSIPNYNIVYIAIDSWNPSTCDSIVTPNVYKLMQKGNYFAKHYSGGNGTRSGIFGLFFGLSHTYDKEFHLLQRSPLLIDQLIDRNYAIQAFPSANFTTPPFHETIYRRVPNINLGTKGESLLERDTNLTKNAINYINAQDKNKPFFTFLFYDLPHGMTIAKEYRNQFQPSWDKADYLLLNNNLDRTPFFNLYKNCVYNADRLIGEVLNNLEEKGLMENTIVVITGDHGQEFNENKKNYWGHGSNFSDWQIQIPLVLYYPGMEEPGKRFEHTTTHYDVTPTMMTRFLGVKNPTADYSMGYDLYDTDSRYPHIIGGNVNFGFIFEDIIVTTNHLGTLLITDRQMNEKTRASLNITKLQKAIEKKNRFYKQK